MRKLFDGVVVDYGHIVERIVLVHPYPDQIPELERLIDDGNPVVIPHRRPATVRASWIKYGKDPDGGFAGMTIGEWFNVQIALADRTADTFYLDIDIPNLRELQLNMINAAFGLELETDWEPVRQAGG